MKKQILGSAIASMVAACTYVADAEQLFIHDPVVAQEGDRYYLYSTGPGITAYSSPDLEHWEHLGEVFNDAPTWAHEAAPEFSGHLWAPDIIERDGSYYLYYSVSAFGKNTSGIGLTITKSMDPSSKDYGWEDQGAVITSVPGRDLWNAIDPHIIVDDNGDAWMSFGSFFSGLKIFKLNEQWDTPAEPQEWYTIARGERPAYQDDRIAGPADIEAPFIYRHGEYYYLFASKGFCCRGKDSTYHLVVGRSKALTGPYLDREGIDMNAGGGSLFIGGNEAWPGLGHNSVYNFKGKDLLVMHAYEAADKGRQKLKILEISWTEEGWPEVDPAELDRYRSVLMDK